MQCAIRGLAAYTIEENGNGELLCRVYNLPERFGNSKEKIKENITGFCYDLKTNYSNLAEKGDNLSIKSYLSSNNRKINFVVYYLKSGDLNLARELFDERINIF